MKIQSLVIGQIYCLQSCYFENRWTILDTKCQNMELRSRSIAQSGFARFKRKLTFKAKKPTGRLENEKKTDQRCFEKPKSYAGENQSQSQLIFAAQESICWAKNSRVLKKFASLKTNRSSLYFFRFDRASNLWPQRTFTENFSTILKSEN